MDFEEIYDQYYTDTRNFIKSIVRDDWVADDLVQETFIRIHQKTGSLKDPSKISSWIFSIAYNLCIDHFRYFQKTSKIQQMETVEIPYLYKGFESIKTKHCIQSFLINMPFNQREVIVLFDIMGFNHREIADIIGIKVDNAKMRLNRARKNLKHLLQKNCVFEYDTRNVLVCNIINKNKGR